MVEILDIPIFADRKRILRTIRSKAKGCGHPCHWVLVDPVKSNEKMWLRPKDLDKRHGAWVQVRRVLYYIEYEGLPLKRITMVCDEFQEPELRGRCINPTHMRVRGWEDEANAKIEGQIEKGWLYPDDAERYFGWENKNNVKLPNEFSCELSI
jgi:hypothetical protein